MEKTQKVSKPDKDNCFAFVNFSLTNFNSTFLEDKIMLSIQLSYCCKKKKKMKGTQETSSSLLRNPLKISEK